MKNPVTILVALTATLALAACGRDPVQPQQPTLADVIDGSWVGLDADTVGGRFVVAFSVTRAAGAGSALALAGSGVVSIGDVSHALPVDAVNSNYTVSADTAVARVVLADADVRVDVLCQIVASDLFACRGGAQETAGRRHAVIMEKLRPIG